MSYETRYAAAAQARFDRQSSSPEAAEARLKLKDALKKAKEDTSAKFPEIDATNFSRALEYQSQRIEFWRNENKA